MNEGNNAKKVGIILGVVAIVVVIGIIVAMSMNNNTSNTSTTPSPTETSGSNDTDTATITYADGTFSPATITVKVGDTVSIKNTSDSVLRFDSDPHPAHTNNPELNVDTVEPGQTKTFTVNRAGTFGYHNHLSPSEEGIIVVE